MAVGDHVIAYDLDLDALRLHEQFLDDGVRGLGAARGDLDGVAANDLPPKNWSSNRLVNWTC